MSKKNLIIIGIIALVVIIFFTSFSNRNSSGDGGSKTLTSFSNPFSFSKNKDGSSVVSSDNTSQTITIKAKGGYSPNVIKAKAGIPGKLEMVTENTYDCSAALFVDKLNVQKVLPKNGTTSFDFAAQTAGTKINGQCSMGMYDFVIEFE